MNQLLRHDRHCRLCGSSRITTVLKLRDTPLEDRFVREKGSQPTFPLEVALCEDCGYLHLPYIVSPEASYSDYMYVSGVTVGLRNHYDAYAKEIVDSYHVPVGSLVVDLGSNDGSMLASFQRLGMKVLGVEPATATAKFANENGLPTINDFFTAEVAARILQENSPARVATANYMYANIDDVLSFTKAVASILAPDGIFVVQTGYHPEQMKIKMFDYVYHEHFSYFTVEVLRNIFAICGLELIEATKTTPKGGSLRVVGQLAGASRSVSSSVEEIVAEERKSGMRNVETYYQFGTSIQAAKEKVLEILNNLKSQGEKIVGFGASHSTTTLTYHFELADYLDYLVDDNELKHGTYSPGNLIPVYPSSKLYEDAPSKVLILAWQHQDAIIEKHKSLLSMGSEFIIPLPSLTLVPYES